MISKVIKSRVLSVCLCSNRSLSRGRRIYEESETSPADPPGRRPVDHHRWTRGHLRSDSLPHCLTPSLKFQSTGRWKGGDSIPTWSLEPPRVVQKCLFPVLARHERSLWIFMRLSSRVSYPLLRGCRHCFCPPAHAPPPFPLSPGDLSSLAVFPGQRRFIWHETVTTPRCLFLFPNLIDLLWGRDSLVFPFPR